MRRLPATFQPGVDARVHRVVDAEGLAPEWTPELHFLIRVAGDDETAQVLRLRDAGLANVAWVAAADVEAGDVVVPQPHRGQLVVLYRESDVHHALLLTNRCNSYCLMCSQPPTPQDDAWRIGEALDILRHIRRAPAVLGLSGGEPLLLGAGLRRVLDAVAEHHPATCIEVLTNGRLFADEKVAYEVLEGLAANVRWLVPLYGHADFLHDFVVQAHGAFEETMAGLLVLQDHAQPIQLRTVLIEPVLRILPELAGFVGRNLPFVQEVALMACEPIGFALANREQCEVDLLDWAPALESASRVLDRHGVRHLFMNAPLCSLPRSLWPAAHRSISDWKNTYAAECDGCAAKQQCCGLFAWHETGWKPTRIKAVEEVEA